MNASNKQTTHETDTQSDKVLARLLTIAGPRVEPSAAITEAVRQAAYETWQRRLRRRRFYRALGYTAAAASLATVALLLRPGAIEPGNAAIAATIDRIEGIVEIGTDDQWQRATTQTALYEGHRLRTSSGGGVGLLLDDGTSVRIAEQTVATLTNASQLELVLGRVYIDSGPDHDPAESFTVATGLGVIRDIGTQFEVAVLPSGTAVRVREGQIIFSTATAQFDATAGQMLSVSETGETHRAMLRSDDPAWQWVETLAPQFDADGRTLTEFLNWVARETGRQLSFATPDTEKSASNTFLHGSIAGLAPSTALTAVMATTEFDFQLIDTEIVVRIRTARHLE